VKTLAHAREKAEILERLRAVRPDSARRWGRMTADQMICHLSDVFLSVLGRRPVSHDTRLLNRTIVKWIALYAPLRWPAGIETRPELDQQAGLGTRPGDFAADVALLVSLVETITASTTCFAGQVHPIFGRMSDRDWLRWAYLHMDHHLRQFGA
jgi:hypothetical protein